MIDIDKIESQCNAAIQNGYGHLPVIECGNAAKVLELISLLRQAEKDAARYRWLRDVTNRRMQEGPAIAMCNADGSVMIRESGSEYLVCGICADEAVDEAMSDSKA